MFELKTENFLELQKAGKSTHLWSHHVFSEKCPKNSSKLWWHLSLACNRAFEHEIFLLGILVDSHCFRLGHNSEMGRNFSTSPITEIRSFYFLSNTPLTLPETNSLPPENWPGPKRKSHLPVPSIFRSESLSFREGSISSQTKKKTCRFSNKPKKKQPHLNSECNGSSSVTGGRGSRGEDGALSRRFADGGATDARGRDWRSSRWEVLVDVFPCFFWDLSGNIPVAPTKTSLEILSSFLY